LLGYEFIWRSDPSLGMNYSAEIDTATAFTSVRTTGDLLGMYAHPFSKSWGPYFIEGKTFDVRVKLILAHKCD